MTTKLDRLAEEVLAKMRSDKPLKQSTREHWRYAFAGQAMQGFIMNISLNEVTNTHFVKDLAVELADLLLAELEKGK